MKYSEKVNGQAQPWLVTHTVTQSNVATFECNLCCIDRGLSVCPNFLSAPVEEHWRMAKNETNKFIFPDKWNRATACRIKPSCIKRPGVKVVSSDKHWRLYTRFQHRFLELLDHRKPIVLAAVAVGVVTLIDLAKVLAFADSGLCTMLMNEQSAKLTDP